MVHSTVHNAYDGEVYQDEDMDEVEDRVVVSNTMV
jgi:hypothetical protein